MKIWNGNTQYSLAIREEHYPEVRVKAGGAIPWTEGTILIEDADKKGCLDEAKNQTRNARYMRETIPNKERILEIFDSEEFKRTFWVNAQATRETRTRNNNAALLKVEGGASISDVARIIMELHRAGQPVKTMFNSFVIDTRQYNSEQAIIEAYDRAIEEHQKSKAMLKSGVEATEEGVGNCQINNEVNKIEAIAKGRDAQQEVGESTLE